MSLRSKIALILSAVVGLYAVTFFVIQSQVLLPSFHEVEQEEAQQDLQRIHQALLEQVQGLTKQCLNWSARDDTFSFVNEPTDSYRRSNLSPTSMRRIGIDLLFIIDKDGVVIAHHLVDPDTAQPLQLKEFPQPPLQFHRAHRLLQRENGRGDDWNPAGLLLTEHKPILISAQPILTTEGEGPERGTVIMGRFLAGNLGTQLAEQTRTDFDFWQLDGRPLPDAEEAVKDDVTAMTTPLIREVNDDVLHVYGTFENLYGQPELLLRANVQRKVRRTGSTALQFALNSMVVAGLLMLLVLMGLLQKIVITPISTLTRHAVAIGKSEDLHAKLSLDRDDEVGVLSREFDNMMGKLEQAQMEIVTTARAAGMSEIATGILHNVGNVLNSVNISASMVGQKVEGMGVDDLIQFNAIIAEHKDDLATFIANDARGEHLQPYLAALTEHLSEQKQLVAAEVVSLTDGIEHIRELIKSQQTFAVQTELEEAIDVVGRIDEALNISDQALSIDPTLEVTREYAELPRILIDKHKLLEILVNLIQNARQAMAASTPKQLTLRAFSTNDDHVIIEVEDNGCGIPADNLAKVFAMGFTTKESGHGYGLHTSGNAATEMGGSLVATSAGPDQGAKFTLTLPMKVAVTAGDVQ